MPNTNLKSGMTLPEMQRYIKEVCKENGWNKDTTEEKFLLFTEEVGELAKAVRKSKGLYSEDAKNDKNARLNLEEEFADVLSYLIDLANMHGVDLETEFIKKETHNRKRVWK